MGKSVFKTVHTEGRAPDQALRLEERVSALVLAGQEDHVAGFWILPAAMSRLAAEASESLTKEKRQASEFRV